MKVIILAGGRGTRLPVSAKNIPKPLVPVNNKTLLDYHIENLESFGFSDIRLSLGHMAEKIIDHMKNRYGNKYEWVVEPEKLGTGGALKYASTDLSDDFVAFNVDDFPKIDFADFTTFHKNHDTENTIAIYRVNDARNFGLVKHDNIHVQKFLEKPQKKISGHINTGLYVLSPKIFARFPQKTFSIEIDVFPRLAEERRIACYRNIDHWFTTGIEESLKKAAKFLRQKDGQIS